MLSDVIDLLLRMGRNCPPIIIDFQHVQLRLTDKKTSDNNMLEPNYPTNLPDIENDNFLNG